jgi:hypothetical protein
MSQRRHINTTTVSCRSMLPLQNLPRIVGRQSNRNNVPARKPEAYCRHAVSLQDFAFKFSKIFRGLHVNSHGGRRMQPHNAKYHFFKPKPSIGRCMYFKPQKFTSQNLVNQAAVFYVRNALKVVCEHLRFKHFFRGCIPGPPLKGEGGHGREKEGRDGAPHFNLVPHRFLWASHGPRL